MKKFKNLLIAVLFILVIVPLVFADTISVRPYGIATPYWYGYSAGVKSTYYLEHPTLTANDQVVSEDATQTLTNKTLTSPVLTSPTISGSGYGSGAAELYGFIDSINNSTDNVTLTLADSGKTYVSPNYPITYTLPADPTGGVWRFVVGAYKNLIIEPTGADWIMNKTDTSGDYYRSSTIGSTLVVRGISASLLSVESEIGTWVEQ